MELELKSNLQLILREYLLRQVLPLVVFHTYHLEFSLQPHKVDLLELVLWLEGEVILKSKWAMWGNGQEAITEIQMSTWGQARECSTLSLLSVKNGW